MAIHLACKYALATKLTKFREGTVESSNACEKIYELNFLHVESLAAKTSQASLGFKYFTKLLADPDGGHYLSFPR